jgi:excisionase family DNA binding protein
MRQRLRFMTTGEIARSWHVTIPTVKRWIRAGHLRAFKTRGGRFRVTNEEFRRFEAQRRIPVAPEVRALPRILVVDDDAALLEALGEALRWGGRYEVELCRDSTEALTVVRTFAPHLLVLDVRMQGLTGFQVCRRLKGDPVTKATRILAITGLVAADTREHVMEAGADAFLAKPISLDALEREVAALLAVSR